MAHEFDRNRDCWDCGIRPQWRHAKPIKKCRDCFVRGGSGSAFVEIDLDLLDHELGEIAADLIVERCRRN